MARLSHEDIAQVLADIVNEVHEGFTEGEIDPIRTIQINRIIMNFFDERSDNLGELYDSKLNFIEK